MSAPTRHHPWATFVQRWGWRAYAVPALAVVTVGVLVVPSGGGSGSAAAAAGTGGAGVGSAPAASAEQLSAPQTLPLQTDPADATACAGNTVAQRIVVSIAAQHAWACAGSTLALSTPVTTGVPVPDRETRLGTWTIQYKQTDRDLVGPGYAPEHVDYWMPYDGDFGLHDATFQTFAFGTAGWKTDGSHGCVHFPLDAMAWVYRWAAVGAEVTIKA